MVTPGFNSGFNPGFNPGLISVIHPMVTHNWWPLLAILLLLLTELV